jgi:hypothetical protein
MTDDNEILTPDPLEEAGEQEGPFSRILTAHDPDALPEEYRWETEDVPVEHLTALPRGAAMPDLYPGRDYYVSNSLEAQLRDFNALFPGRAKASDGWLGNASHQAEKSDHNPDWPSGIIRAGDLTTTSLTDAQRRAVIEDLIETELANPVDRIWYVIHKLPGKSPQIWSRTTDWEPRRYTGASPHDHHFHTSIMRTRAAAADTKPWWTKLKPAAPLPAVSAKGIAAAFKAGTSGSPSGDVRDVQHALNRALKPSPDLDLTGIADAATKAAYKAWQRKLGYTGDDADGIPGPTSLGSLPLRVNA